MANMELGLALIISFFCIGYSVIASIRMSGRVTVLSPVMLFVLSSILFINIGFLLLAFKYRTEEWAIRALLSSSIGLFSVTLGAQMGYVLLRTRRIWKQDLKQYVRLNLRFGTAVGVALIVFGIVAMYFILVGFVPLFSALALLPTQGITKGFLNTLRTSRDVYINVEARYIPLQGLWEAFRYFGLPIVSVWFLHFYRSGYKKFLSAIFLSMSILFILSTGQRWPLMYLLTVLLVYLSWESWNQPRYFFKMFRKILLVALIAGVALSVLLARTQEERLEGIGAFSFGVRDLAQRIFLGNASISFHSYSIFPDQKGWLYGRSWLQNLACYMPGPSPSYSVTFYRMVTGDPKGYTAPPDFYTEAYINFGWGGVVIISLIWGSIMAFLQLWIAKERQTLFRRSLSALVVTLIAFTTFSGVTFILGGIIIAVLIWVLILAITLIVRIFSLRNRPSLLRIRHMLEISRAD